MKIDNKEGWGARRMEKQPKKPDEYYRMGNTDELRFYNSNAKGRKQVPCRKRGWKKNSNDREKAQWLSAYFIILSIIKLNFQVAKTNELRRKP